jgi:hypothetical protein
VTLVSYIHSHLVLVVGINNNRYIKLFWHSPGRNVEFAPLALVLLLPGCFLILSTNESSPLRGWIVNIMLTGELSIHSRVATPTLTAPL